MDTLKGNMVKMKKLKLTWSTSLTKESKLELTRSVWDKYAKIWMSSHVFPAGWLLMSFLILSQSQFPYLQIVDAKIIYPNIDLYYKIKIDSQCNMLKQVLDIIIIGTNSNWLFVFSFTFYDILKMLIWFIYLIF